MNRDILGKGERGLDHERARKGRERRESFGEFGYVKAGEGVGRPGAGRCVGRRQPTNCGQVNDVQEYISFIEVRKNNLGLLQSTERWDSVR